MDGDLSRPAGLALFRVLQNISFIANGTLAENNAESILLPAYRGRGLYRHFFAEREAHARGFDQYEWITHCAVQRPDDHPARPADHEPLDAVWRHFGYEPRADLVARYPWRDVGHAEETTKPLLFWLKRL